MKILWITYVAFPEALELMTSKPQQRKGSGGWLYGAANALLENTDLELHVATVSRLIPQFSIQKGAQITYYLIPFGKGFDAYHRQYDYYWKRIVDDYQPDVVHIHGVESTLALSFVRACGKDNVVVSIQGLTSIISRFYYSGISNSEINRNITVGDLIRRKTLYQYRDDFVKKGIYEVEILKSIKHVIGRTNWDRDHVLAINPNLHYHFCNETLRSEFYTQSWSYENCSKHTIFLSAASFAFKGAHFVFKALPLIRRFYPDVEVRIAGSSNIKPTNIKDKLRQTGYEHYLGSLIEDLAISRHIKFLGALSSEEMRDEYLRANVFVCPSTVENSSNSVAEAQILGVPLVASYVGGIPGMVPDERCGKLFRCGEYEMLAALVCELFEESKTFDNSYVQMIASQRHNQKSNAVQTYQIYKKIAEL